MRNHVLVRLDLVEQAAFFEDLDDDLARDEAVLAVEPIPGAVQRCRGVEAFEKILVVLDGDVASMSGC
jgi:hypothetical protein